MTILGLFVGCVRHSSHSVSRVHLPYRFVVRPEYQNIRTGPFVDAPNLNQLPICVLLSGVLPQTWAGSVACAAGSFVCSLLLLLYLQLSGLMLQHTDPINMLLGCCIAAVAAAAVESLPLPDADNVLVPAAAAAVGLWWFELRG